MKKSENEGHLFTFSSSLMTYLKDCITKSTSKCRLRKEKLWGFFHQLRTSQRFTTLWTKFLEEYIKEKTSPILYQSLTYKLFKELVKAQHPKALSADDTPTNQPLQYEEQNALRYVAGYICRTLQDRLQSSSIPGNEGMILCLQEMGTGGVESETSEDWINLIDRGGLQHVSEHFYTLFTIMEETVQDHWTKSSAENQSEGARQEMVKNLLQNEDVQFQWCFCYSGLSANDETASNLLRQLFVNIRGHAFASSMLELYKQVNDETLQ